MRASPVDLRLQEVPAAAVIAALAVITVGLGVLLEVGKEHRRLSGGLALVAGLAGAAFLWFTGAIDR